MYEAYKLQIANSYVPNPFMTQLKQLPDIDSIADAVYSQLVTARAVKAPRLGSGGKEVTPLWLESVFLEEEMDNLSREFVIRYVKCG